MKVAEFLKAEAVALSTGVAIAIGGVNLFDTKSAAIDRAEQIKEEVVLRDAVQKDRLDRIEDKLDEALRYLRDKK
jgi:uncharacterized membrane protein YukC